MERLVSAAPALESGAEKSVVPSGECTETDSDSDSDSDSGVENERLMHSTARVLCEQLSYADIILLNKMDRIDEAQRRTVEATISEKNPTAQCLWCEYGRIAPDHIIKERKFSIDSDAFASVFRARWHHEHDSGEHTTFGSIAVSRDGPVDELAFQD